MCVIDVRAPTSKEHPDLVFSGLAHSVDSLEQYLILMHGESKEQCEYCHGDNNNKYYRVLLEKKVMGRVTICDACIEAIHLKEKYKL